MRDDAQGLVALILSLLEIDVGASDLAQLAATLKDQSALAKSLEEIDLWEIEPAFMFDPTWHE